MNKARPVYHSGLALVQLSDLSEYQCEFLRNHVPPTHFINISIEGGGNELCIAYEEYEHCYLVLNSHHYDHYFESQL